jgi:hypothetical protein
MGLGLWRWAFLCRFTLSSSCIFHISVSSQYCPIDRRFLEKQAKLYERRSASPIKALYESLLALRCSLRPKAKRGAFAAPIGKAQRIRSANEEFSRFFLIRCALPISGARIVGPIVLALHKGNERIGEARATNRSASPIVIEITNKFCCTDRKRKYVYYEPTANQNLKIMPSATVPGQSPTIGAILDPP